MTTCGRGGESGKRLERKNREWAQEWASGSENPQGGDHTRFFRTLVSESGGLEEGV